MRINKLITEAFYLTKDIEKHGSGYRRIREYIRDYPTMYFEFEENSGGYLTKIGYKKQRILNNAIVSQNDELKIAPQYLENKEPETDSDELNDELNEGQQKVLEYIQTNPGKMSRDISFYLKMPFGTVDRHIRVLLKKNKIERRGSKKSGGYYSIA